MEINIWEIVFLSKELKSQTKKKLAVKIIIGHFYSITAFKPESEQNIYKIEEKYDLNLDNDKANNVII